jgi:hypothetical protein
LIRPHKIAIADMREQGVRGLPDLWRGHYAATSGDALAGRIAIRGQ